MACVSGISDEDLEEMPGWGHCQPVAYASLWEATYSSLSCSSTRLWHKIQAGALEQKPLPFPALQEQTGNQQKN